MLKGKYLIDINALEEQHGENAGFAYLEHKMRILNKLKSHNIYKNLLNKNGELNTDSLLFLVLELIEQVENMDKKLKIL